ncbi:MAG: hypothetical protein GC189_08010 [Alphaproteobacteria bacterium]|nr:hypothetical protein [Alphaproteobacteria bacterium]
MFVRSKTHPMGRRLTRRAVLALTGAVYALYGAGCALQLLPLGPDLAASASVAGLLMIAASLAAFALLAGSSLQRQAQEPESQLDERERFERNRAAYVAFSAFAGLVLLGVFYIVIANDLAEAGKAELWIPQTSAHWNAVFWGLMLLALTLPAAVLAWSSGDAEDQAADDL